MNHKIIRTTIMTLMILVLLTGCATTVSVRYLVPAQIDMSAHRYLAVLSVEPYRFGFFNSVPSIIPDLSGTSDARISSGFRPNTEREVARHLSTRIVGELSKTGYFDLMTPPSSDAIGVDLIRLRDLGYHSVLMVRVTLMDVDEYIHAREETVKLPASDGSSSLVEQKVLRHYVKQKIAYAVEFTIKETSNGNILAMKTFADTKESSYRIESDGSGAKAAPDLYDWFTGFSTSYAREFADMLVPRWVSTHVALMDNKPELRSLKSAYEHAKKGNLVPALEIFHAEWRRSRHVRSGYNAAIIMESMGRVEEAIELIEEGWRFSGNRTVETRMQRMREAMSAHERAQQQL